MAQVTPAGNAAINFARAWLKNAPVAAATLVLVGLVWVATLERVGYEHSGTISDIERDNANFTMALEEHTLRTLKSVHQMLADIAMEYRDEGRKLDIAHLIDEGVVDDALFHFIGVVDERGNLVLGNVPFSQTYMGDREFFLVHREKESQDMFIGKPLLGRITGQWAIPLSRRVNKRDGTFGGVAFAGVDPDYFERFYQKANLGGNGIVMLVGLDGIARVRQVGTTSSYGQDMRSSTLFAELAKAPSGSFRSSGNLDGTRRFTSYRTVTEYPLIVSVGTSVEESLAESRARERTYYVDAALASALLLVAGLGASVSLARQRKAKQEIERGNARFRTTFNQAAVAIVLSTPDGRILDANEAFYKGSGYSREESNAMTFRDIVHPDDLAAVAEERRKLESGEAETSAQELRFLKKDGSIGWAARGTSAVRGPYGKVEYFVSMYRDITEQKRAVEDLAESQERFKQLAENIHDVFFLIDADASRVHYVNPAYEKIWCRSCESLYRQPHSWADSIHPEDRAHALEKFTGGLKSGGFDYEYRIVRPDGSVRWIHVRGFPIHNAAGVLYRTAGVAQDITPHREMQERLMHLAHYDTLTGLPNRTLCFDRLHQALGQARRKNWIASFLFIDLDRFKNVNDTLGHLAGDELLRQVAARLKHCVRDEDTVARLGGDEFGVILSDLPRADDAAVVAKKAIDALARPFDLGGYEAFVTASVGIASFPRDSENPEALVKNADAAMFRAKLIGRNNYQFYTVEMNERALENLNLENQLRRAVERKEFLLHFQPKIDLTTRRATSCEALLRWNLPGNGLVSPKDFMPLLEESGLIVPVGEWVLGAACAQVRAWLDAGIVPVPIAVNLSARQFQRNDICATVAAALHEHGVDPRFLELGITETAAMQNAEETVTTLRRLRNIGVRMSIDDFGTGYSSLGYLKRFPVYALKIDRSFVTGLPDDPEDVSIARAVIGMAHSLHLKVIAEGVETEEQRRFLAANGCDEMQGYLVARPMPAGEFTRFVEKRRRQFGTNPDERKLAAAA
jgi:diguanylate cyclase (GGDEF)-like protein/PAS domain S-box-containing protein